MSDNELQQHTADQACAQGMRREAKALSHIHAQCKALGADLPTHADILLRHAQRRQTDYKCHGGMKQTYTVRDGKNRKQVRTRKAVDAHARTVDSYRTHVRTIEDMVRQYRRCKGSAKRDLQLRARDYVRLHNVPAPTWLVGSALGSPDWTFSDM